MGVAPRGLVALALLALAIAGVPGCRCGGDGTTDAGGPGPGTDSAPMGTDSAPMGTDSAPPNDCGNLMVEPPEDCDDGNMSEDDLCLNDCTFACGDGVVNAIEICDTGIAAGSPGACPTDCDDGDACTTDTLSGSECSTECLHGDITAAVPGDGCCPPGENTNTDSDCPPVCDNGIIEGSETCEPMSTCPTMCSDGIACTADTMTGSAATCDSACTFPAITACADADGCCPSGCTAATDADCSATCGNGVVDPPLETCDPPASCPTMCDDGIACTTDVLTGSAATCSAACSSSPITAPINGDGCCPPSGNANNDTDCPPVCGNGVIETGETCDDGNTTAGDGCDAACLPETAAPTAFRMSDLDLRDPHVYVSVPFFGCTDVTNTVPLMASPSVNEQLQDAITMDGDGDGFLDLSFLLIFRPLDQAAAAMGAMDFAVGECTAPMAGTSCDLAMGTMPEMTTYTNMSTGTCMGPYAGTTTPLGSGYSPAVADATGPCFVSASIDITLDLAGTPITLTDSQAAATYVGAPATSLTNGLLRGFISEADAAATMIDLGGLGMTTLAGLLPDGPGGANCATHDDRDVGLDGTTMGWWFYLNFDPGANVVPYTGP